MILTIRPDSIREPENIANLEMDKIAKTKQHLTKKVKGNANDQQEKLRTKSSIHELRNPKGTKNIVDG